MKFDKRTVLWDNVAHMLGKGAEQRPEQPSSRPHPLVLNLGAKIASTEGKTLALLEPGIQEQYLLKAGAALNVLVNLASQQQVDLRQDATITFAARMIYAVEGSFEESGEQRLPFEDLPADKQTQYKSLAREGVIMIGQYIATQEG